MDFFAIAQIMPFDFVVTGKRTNTLMNEAKVESWHNVSVMGRLGDLRSELEQN